jgi:hypothetical protein
MPLGTDSQPGLLEVYGHNRLLTILGSGGIGKTTVALTVASQLGDAYPDGSCFVDLGQVTDATAAPRRFPRSDQAIRRLPVKLERPSGGGRDSSPPDAANRG